MRLRKRPTVEPPASRYGAASACPDCRQVAAGRFCPACGEEKLRAADRSLRGLLGETLNVVTNVESNIFRSFASLISRPGLLTAEYFAGRRKRYLKPLQLFLFCNLVFFFVQSYTGFNSLSTPLYVHLQELPYSGYAREKVGRAVAAKGVALAEYEARFDATISTQSKTLVVLMIPMLALLMQALYWRNGRYVVEHLVFSTHFYAFFLLLLSAVMLCAAAGIALARKVGAGPGLLGSDLFVSTVLGLACAGYLFAALGRAYAQGLAPTLLKCAALTFGVYVALQLYRFALFFTTFYSV